MTDDEREDFEVWDGGEAGSIHLELYDGYPCGLILCDKFGNPKGYISLYEGWNTISDIMDGLDDAHRVTEGDE